MSNPLPIPAREAQAKREIGLTNVSPVCKVVLLAGFVLLLLLTTGVQLWVDRSFLPELQELPRAARRGWEIGKTADHGTPLFTANRHLLAAMQDWEDQLEDNAWFHEPLLKRTQPLLWRLGSGNGQAVRGRDDWLLYQPDIDYLLQGPFDLEHPLAAILDFRDQLAERNIHLVIVPAPAKTQLHPEALTIRSIPLPLRNPAETSLFDRLHQAGVPVIDAAALLAATEPPAFLRTDTHWTPRAMRHVAEQTATTIHQLGVLPPDADPIPVLWEQSEIQHLGDIAEMLAFPPGQTLIPPETILHTRAELKTDAPPTVLLLGDSFSNIFSLDAMGWGEGGGFADHLAAALRQPVRRIVRNDAGASATREMLSRDLARGEDRLDGIHVVVWQFAARELKFGDWRPMPFQYQPRTRTEPADHDPQTVRDGGLLDGVKTITATATLREISPIPRPGQVAYADHVATAHLTDIRTDDGRIINAEAVARFQSMRNHTLLEAARWRSGQQLHLRLIPFSEVEDRYGALNTSELDDLDLMLATPFWIEEVLP